MKQINHCKRQPAILSLIFFISLSLITISGCGEGNVTGPKKKEPPTVPPIESLEDFAEAVGEMETVVQSVLPDKGTPIEQRNLLTELKMISKKLSALPHVKLVLLYPVSLSAQAVLDNGKSVLIINNSPLIDKNSPNFISGRKHYKFNAKSTSNKSATSKLVGTGKAVIAAFGNGKIPNRVVNKLSNMMSSMGYKVTNGMSVDDMRNYKKIGVLYLDTHSGQFTRATISDSGTISIEGGRSYLGIETQNEFVRSDDLIKYKDDLAKNRIIITIDGDGGKAHIGITAAFIKHYWSFDEGLVYLQSCFMGSEPFALQNFSCYINGLFYDDEECVENPIILHPEYIRNALLEKGANLVIGYDNYTNTTDAEPGILFFFDRMLGINKQEKIDPPLRPFDANEVKAAMDDEDLLTYTVPAYIANAIKAKKFPKKSPVVNVKFFGNPDEVSLAPSIKYFEVEPPTPAKHNTERITLHGNFGKRGGKQGALGKVYLDSKLLTVLEWTSKKIKIEVPYGLTGNIRVETAPGVKSNDVPLTQWKGEMKVIKESSDKSLKVTMTLDIRFRGDLHRFRNSLQGEQKYHQAGSFFTPKSSGTVVAEGENKIYRWYGSSDLKFGINFFRSTGKQTILRGLLSFYPDDEEVEICPNLLGYYFVDNKFYNTTIFTGILWHDCITVSINENYVIEEGTEENANYRLEWSGFKPVNPPDYPLDGSWF